MREDFGLTIEDVMRMPFRRFMALGRLQMRRSIERTNAERRKEWEAKRES